MITLIDVATNAELGTITDTQLKFMIDQLEEESADDQDYYINRATLDVIGDGRATDHLLNLLRTALGASDGIDIRWERR